MSFISPAITAFHTALTPATRRIGVAAVGAALAIALLDGSPALADEQEAASQATDQETSEMSARQLRHEARLRERAEARAAEEEKEEQDSGESDETIVVTGNRPVVYVAVEPQMECRRVQVVGSRVPREVCTPVGQASADEEHAKEFLRRTRERSTLTVSCPQTNPALPGPAAAVC